MGLYAYFQTLSVAPQPLGTVYVGKGCIVASVGCNFYVSVWGWVSQGLVAVTCLLVMMTLGVSRSFSCSFQFLSFYFADLLRLCASPALHFLQRLHFLFAHIFMSEPFVQSLFLVFWLRYLLSSYPWVHCVFPPLVSF